MLRLSGNTIMKTTRNVARRGGVLAGILITLTLLVGLFLMCQPHGHKFALPVQQKAQFHGMDAAIALFRSEHGQYPPSEANDPEGKPYCGAMKLCEAMMGRDLLGIHPNTAYRQDGLDSDGSALYQPNRDNLKARMGPYLPLESANATMLRDIYGEGGTGAFPEDLYVLCDVFRRKWPSGERTGMPILYYEADPNGTVHDAGFPDNPANIYDYRDNQAILELGVPGRPGVRHPLADPKVFYEMIRDYKIKSPVMPQRAGSFILISAGRDGLYGTADDVFNFDWRPSEQRGPE